MFWIITLIILGTVSLFLYFLLAPTAEKNGGSFDGFVRESGPDDDLIDTNAAPDPYKRVFTSPGKQVLLLFGTEYGFSEQLAKKLFDEIINIEGIQPRLLNMLYYQSIDFSQEQTIFVICSTSGDGVPPSDARPFYEWIMSNPVDLKHINYSLLGLGDSSYPHFCRVGTALDARFKELKAKEVAPFSIVDLENWTTINKWMNEVITTVPKLDIEIRDDYLDVESIGNDKKGPSRTAPFFGPIIVKQELTQGDDKEVLHCEFDLRSSEISYTSGDALGIYPLNNPPEVESFLKALENRNSPNVHNYPVDIPSGYAPLPEGDKMSLKEALTKYYDLKAIRPDLIKFVVENAKDPKEKEKGESLLQKGLDLKANKELEEYIYHREVSDVLEEFRSSVFEFGSLLKFMRPLQPRYYSISSSPSTSSSSRVSVTAAVVRYQTLGKPRTGVTTTFLSDRLKIGENCGLFISKNPDFRLPADILTPIIMIGPGTGIAPFRAFLQERTSAVVINSPLSQLNHLYFGCRNRDIDFLYKQELTQLEKDDKLTLKVAFSREQQNKVYVQHLIKQDASTIWNLLQKGAHIYVCGDARNMARDVEDALLEIFENEGKLSKEDSTEFLSSLEKGHRYQRDVWAT